MHLRAVAIVIGSVLAACAVDDSPTSTITRPAQRATVEAASVARPLAPRTGPVAFTLRQVVPDTTAPATWAFDVDGHEFPARALDPVLIVGDTTLTHYRYLPGGVLRFTAALDQVRAGVSVAIQYGTQASTRRMLTDALVLAVAP